MEVHQQKGEIVEHVDRREFVGKFDAIERRRRAVDDADVAQGQIAMATARLAPRMARVEQRAVRLQQRAQPRVMGLYIAARRRRKVAQALLVEQHDAAHRLAPAAFPDHFRLVVKGGDFSREPFDDLRRQRAPRGEGFEQRAIVETAHFDNGVDEFARAIERESAIRLAGDAPRAKIERRARCAG